MVSRALLATAIVLTLAGCTGTNDDARTAASPSAGEAAATSTPDTGALRITVTTRELVPVVGAQVLLDETDLALFSGDDGVALFEALEPHGYTVLVAKPGFRSFEERGRVVDVLAGETVEAKMTLEPLPVAQTSYYLTVPFRGFASCSYSAAGTASSPCGRGVTVGGATVNDTNDRSTHQFWIDNMQLSGIVLEAAWQPTVGVFAEEMFISLSKAISCTAAGICGPDGQLSGAGGPSPIRYQWPTLAATTQPATSFGADASAFPAPAWAAVRAYCPSGCTATVTFQQPYDAYATAFYGENIPSGWSALAGA